MTRSVSAMRPSLRTNEQGLKTWRTTDQQLARLADLHRGSVLFTISPPDDCLIPRIYKSYKLDELKQGSKLKFGGRQGIRIKGTVIGQQDRRPVNGARLYVMDRNAAVPTATKFFTTTDAEGKWSIVVPRVDTVQVGEHRTCGL